MAGDETTVGPLDGLDDVDGDVDIEAIVAGDRPEKGDNPIARAAEKLRGEETVDEADLGDEPEAEGESPDQGDKEDGEEKTDDEEGEEAEGEDGEGEEGEDDDEGTDAESKATFKVAIPDLHRRRAQGEDAITLELEGLTQEQHDIIAGHLNRSQQLDVVQDQLNRSRQHEVVARFVESNPLAAMLLIEREDRTSDAPKNLGAKFAEEWMRMNPEAALKSIQKLGFHDPDALDAERLKERAETAELKAKGIIDEARTKTTGDMTRQRFTSETAAVLRQFGNQLELEGEELRDFVTLSAQRIKRVYDSRIEAGRDPRLTRNDVLGIIQPVLKRFGELPGAKAGKPAQAKGKATAAKGKAGKETIDLAKHFAKREETKARHSKVGGGKGSVTTAQGVTVKKFKGTVGVKAAAARLRQA